MAENQVIAMLWRIEQLRNEGDQEEEILRIFGMIQWMLTLEGNGLLEGMKNQAFAARLKLELLKVQHQMKGMEVPTLDFAKKLVTTGKGTLKTFPQFLDLPDLVHRKIMSYLTRSELLTVARAIPSEAKYFPVPLTWLQMEAVMPLLMEKSLLDPESLMQLSRVNGYFETFIRKQFEQKLKNEYFFGLTMYEDGVPLDRFALTKPVTPLGVPVRVILTQNDDTTAMRDLRVCGSKILHCILKLLPRRGVSQQEELVHVAQSLRLMPNLKTLSVIYNCIPGKRREPDMPIDVTLPELPELKQLVIGNSCPFEILVKVALLEKYASKMETLFLPAPEIPEGPEVFLDGNEDGPPLSLVIQCFGFARGILWPGMHRFGTFPVKKVDISLKLLGIPPPAFLPLLLGFWGKFWRETLEVVRINFRDRFSEQIEVEHENGSILNCFLTSLCFPKMKMLEIYGSLLPRHWDFLLMFPALEELAFYGTLEQEETEEVEEEEKEGNQLMITMYNDKEKMLKSNIWKLLPKLKKVRFDKAGGNGGVESVTRREVVALQQKVRKIGKKIGKDEKRVEIKVEEKPKKAKKNRFGRIVSRMLYDMLSSLL